MLRRVDSSGGYVIKFRSFGGDVFELPLGKYKDRHLKIRGYSSREKLGRLGL